MLILRTTLLNVFYFLICLAVFDVQGAYGMQPYDPSYRRVPYYDDLPPEPFCGGVYPPHENSINYGHCLVCGVPSHDCCDYSYNQPYGIEYCGVCGGSGFVSYDRYDPPPESFCGGVYPSWYDLPYGEGICDVCGGSGFVLYDWYGPPYGVPSGLYGEMPSFWKDHRYDLPSERRYPDVLTRTLTPCDLGYESDVFRRGSYLSYGGSRIVPWTRPPLLGLDRDSDYPLF